MPKSHTNVWEILNFVMTGADNKEEIKRSILWEDIRQHPIFQYANDTTITIKGEESSARNVVQLMNSFLPLMA
jgi:hypothetical protein